MKRPAFQFYPHEWQADIGLRACGIGARGCWIEMTCLMHQAEPYGHLKLNGKAIGPDQLAGMIGGRATAKDVRGWLAELEQNGVFSRNDDGSIFSRRMVRDEAVRQARAAGGQEGAQHGIKGAEHGKKGGRPKKQTGDNNPPTGEEKPPLYPPPSSSSSSSDSSLRSESAPATLAGLACKAMRTAGIGSVNPSDADLLSLLNQGVTPEQLGDLAVELRESRGSGVAFRYVLATMRGRLRDRADRPPASGAPADDVFEGAR